jgi:hypothetical protein
MLRAALFALHPINVESVAWIAERKTVLCMFFVLLTLAACGWYARRSGLGRYLAVVGLFILALAAKPMAVTLPFALLLLDFWPLGRPASTGTLGQTPGTSLPFIQDASYGDTSQFCVSQTLCYLLMPNQSLSGSYSVNSNGTGLFGGGVVSVTNGSTVFHIDESPTNLHPSVVVSEQ